MSGATDYQQDELDLFSAPPLSCLYRSQARGLGARAAEFEAWQAEHGSCLECQDGADYVPTTAVYHCPVCKRWWAWMMPRITTITFGAGPDKPQEG